MVRVKGIEVMSFDLMTFFRPQMRVFTANWITGSEERVEVLLSYKEILQ